ncbi:MAG: hypothetical protein IIZ36_02655, partial [Ruminococcus sp.]|nr:hypothetical protein [Ruminococcus sp.]
HRWGISPRPEDILFTNIICSEPDLSSLISPKNRGKNPKTVEKNTQMKHFIKNRRKIALKFFEFA